MSFFEEAMEIRKEVLKNRKEEIKKIFSKELEGIKNAIMYCIKDPNKHYYSYSPSKELLEKIKEFEIQGILEYELMGFKIDIGFAENTPQCLFKIKWN